MQLLTPEDANDLVRKYQEEDDKEALGQLIGAFEGYLQKYVGILKNKTCNLRDKDSRSFLYLFKGKFLDSQETSKILYVLSSICATMTREDVHGELVVLFIGAVKKFQKRENGPNFSGFLCNYFRYLVKKWITKISKDALARTDLLPFLPDKRINQNPRNVRILRIKATGDIELIDNRHPILKYLTEEERHILSLYYEEGMTDLEIAKALDKSKREVTLARRRSVKICSKLMHRLSK